jgi:hypothetical protein
MATIAAGTAEAGVVAAMTSGPTTASSSPAAAAVATHMQVQMHNTFEAYCMAKTGLLQHRNMMTLLDGTLLAAGQQAH